MRAAGIWIMAVFYSIYIGKLLLQRGRGIQTDQMARNKPKDSTFYTELVMKIATYAVVLVELISLLLVDPSAHPVAAGVGVGIGIAGDIVFGAAVMTMRDSWRAGIAKNDDTELVTDGIYRISRNPAFLGFDCVYLGLLLMFFNWLLLIASIFAAVMLHLQILQEEKHLPNVFGEAYLDYKGKVCRYIGRRG